MKPECLKCKHYYYPNIDAYGVPSCSSPNVIEYYFDQVEGLSRTYVSCKEARYKQCKDGIHFEPKETLKIKLKNMLRRINVSKNK